MLLLFDEGKVDVGDSQRRNCYTLIPPYLGISYYAEITLRVISFLS